MLQALPLEESRYEDAEGDHPRRHGVKVEEVRLPPLARKAQLLKGHSEEDMEERVAQDEAPDVPGLTTSQEGSTDDGRAAGDGPDQRED